MIQERLDTKLIHRIDEIGTFVGNTPLFPIRKAYSKSNVAIYAKLEWQQLGSSVKSRPAYNIIRQAVREGYLSEERHLLDASSGNTAIAYAAIGAAVGIPVTICIPENASKERKMILKSFGVDIIFTPAVGEMNEAQDRAKELALSNPDKYFYADQYANHHNWQAHYHTTAEEIYRQTDEKITHFVAGLGTTGTFVGASRKLRELKAGIQCISLQPNTALHGLEGWKHLATARVPAIYDETVADANLSVDTMEAYEWVKKVAKDEGLLISPSAAANLLGAVKVANTIEEGVIVTTFADDASKYSEVMEELF
jgi:cysteine synthase B